MNLKLEKIFIANDHAGFKLKNFLLNKNQNYKWEDLGVFSEEISDYPEQAEKLCQSLLSSELRENSVGVLVCGSGQGMAIRANRFPGIRAALAWNKDSARLAREHNNANILCLGARLLSFEEADSVLKTFVKTSFKEGRHLERVKKLD